MAKLVFGMMQSLDGYVAGASQTFDATTGGSGKPYLPPPGELLHSHFNDYVRASAGMIYGRRMYEIMRYWDVDHPHFDPVEVEFAAVWRAKPKWVASRTLKSVGPNATIIQDDVGAFVRGLKAKVNGVIDVAGPELAGSLSVLGLIDEYRLYFRPYVLGAGKPFFFGPRPPLHFVGVEAIGDEAVLVTYAGQPG